MVGLHNASDLVAVRYRYVKTPIVVAPRNRAGATAVFRYSFLGLCFLSMRTIHQELPRFDFRSGDPQMLAALVDTLEDGFSMLQRYPNLC